MEEISLQQVYDLALEVSRGVERLESSVDVVLLESRALDHEINATKQLLSGFSQLSLKASAP